MDTDKICPNCEATFSTLSSRNRHVTKGVCGKSGVRSQSTRNPKPPDPPTVVLKEDHEGLLLGNTCFFSKYKSFSLVFYL